MPDNEKKIEEFQSSVSNDVEDIIADIIERAEKEKDNRIKRVSDECINDSYNRISVRTKEIKNACARRVSKQSFDSYRAVLSRRNELVEQFFAGVEAKLAAFSESKKYEDFFMGELKKIDSEKSLKGAVIYVKPADAEKTSFFKDFKDAEIKASKKIKLGGINVFYPEENVWVDLTIDKLLADEKVGFSEKKELSLK